MDEWSAGAHQDYDLVHADECRKMGAFSWEVFSRLSLGLVTHSAINVSPLSI
jgi:hypothetical protein